MSFACEGMYTSRERSVEKRVLGAKPLGEGLRSPGKETGMRLLRRFTPRNDKRWAGLQSGGGFPLYHLWSTIVCKMFENVNSCLPNLIANLFFVLPFVDLARQTFFRTLTSPK